MPTNPIQRKTRNAFLLGMLIMLVVAIVVVAILYFTVFSDMSVGTQDKGGTVYAYRLISQVKSGEQISASKVELVKLHSSDLPQDYASETIKVTAYKSKVDLQPGTVLSKSLLYENEKVANSTRLVELNMLTLPSTLSIGDYIDVRFTMPSGQNFIVLSKKQIMSLNNTTVGLHLTEDEILMMSGAIIESYIIKASNLHAVQYIEAGLQQAAIPTYVINSDVYELIRSNSSKVNIEDYSKLNDSLEGSENLINMINQELGKYTEVETDNIQEGIEKEKETAMELYLSGLQGY